MLNTKPLELLDRYIRVRYPIILIQSHEETRVMDGITHMLASHKQDDRVAERELATWSATEGFSIYNWEEENIQSHKDFHPHQPPEPLLMYPEEATDCDEALRFIMENAEGLDPTAFVFRDLHPYMGDALTTRLLRDITIAFEASFHNLILVSPSWSSENIPPDLQKSIVVIDWPLPTNEELTAILLRCRDNLPKSAKVEVDLNGDTEAIVKALQGLTAFEASSALLSAISQTLRLDSSIIPHLIQEKAAIIRNSGHLEFYPPRVSMSDIGGLGKLKEYAAVKLAAFSQEAKEFGVEAPRGVLLVGIPGTGKSLSAKAIAGDIMPLLRMDIASLFGGILGQSETQVAQALKIAEAVSPCVLWIDEIEKALASGGGELDGGTSARVFGLILTWMQETTKPVYVIATANDVSRLRPELLRRFDDIFFVDLPPLEDRKNIFTIHLQKRSRQPKDFNLSVLARKAWRFTGAEIEKAVREALEMAYISGEELQDEHILKSIQNIVPLYDTMKEKLDALRNWANGRARIAGDKLEPEPKKKKKPKSRSSQRT